MNGYSGNDSAVKTLQNNNRYWLWPAPSSIYVVTIVIYERKKYQKLYKRFTVDRTVRVTISICTDKPARLDSLSAALTCT